MSDWICNVCNARNSVVDGECQFCECDGSDCKRDNCSGDHGHTQAPDEALSAYDVYPREGHCQTRENECEGVAFCFCNCDRCHAADFVSERDYDEYDAA